MERANMAPGSTGIGVGVEDGEDPDLFSTVESFDEVVDVVEEL